MRPRLQPDKALAPLVANSLLMTYDDPQRLPDEFHEQPLTARMLDDFATCPRKFLLSFFTSREAERQFRGGTAALHQAVRAALVESYTRGGPAQVSLSKLLTAFEAHWEGELCADALEEEQLHRQGLKILQEYHEDQAGRVVTVRGSDQRLTGVLAGQQFVAVADVVLEAEVGEVEYRRFVSSRNPLGPAELARDVSAQLFWLLAQQQAIVPRRVCYYALRKRKAYEVVLTAEAAAYAEHEIGSRVARIHREEAFAPRKGKYCRWCRSRARCPLWRS